MRRALKISFNTPKPQNAKPKPKVISKTVQEVVPSKSMNEDESSKDNCEFSISTVISIVKEKIRKLMIFLDEIVEE
jgi:hypothetical protein